MPSSSMLRHMSQWTSGSQGSITALTHGSIVRRSRAISSYDTASQASTHHKNNILTLEGQVSWHLSCLHFPYRRPGLWFPATGGREQLIPFHYLEIDLWGEGGAHTERKKCKGLFRILPPLYQLYLCQKEPVRTCHWPFPHARASPHCLAKPQDVTLSDLSFSKY